VRWADRMLRARTWGWVLATTSQNEHFAL